MRAALQRKGIYRLRGGCYRVSPSPVATELADEAADEVTDELTKLMSPSPSYLAREIGPKYPTAGETPLAACQGAAAALVSEPVSGSALTERCPPLFK